MELRLHSGTIITDYCLVGVVAFRGKLQSSTKTLEVDTVMVDEGEQEMRL